MKYCPESSAFINSITFDHFPVVMLCQEDKQDICTSHNLQYLQGGGQGGMVHAIEKKRLLASETYSYKL